MVLEAGAIGRQGSVSRLYECGGEPLVIAHRGGNEQPENSIAAFKAMRDSGFSYIETDARATSDGVAVICHDPFLDRTTDGTGSISSYTWRELSKVRDLSGNRILRVDEVLDSFPDLHFNIDSKTDAVVAPLIEAVRETLSQSRVCLASFSEKRLRKIRRALPGVATSLGVSAVARLVAATATPTVIARKLVRSIPGPEQGVQVVQIPLVSRGVPVLTQPLVEHAHSRGIAVHAWTINDLAEVDRLISWGVDGFITDEPTAVRAHLREIGAVSS